MSCDRCDISFKLETTVIPTVICKSRNSNGAGAMNDVSKMVMMCAKSAVRESKKVRMMIGSKANGMM